MARRATAQERRHATMHTINRALLTAILISFVLLLVLVSARTAAAQELADVLDQVRPAVVVIQTSHGREGSLGTGFVVRSDGLVLTAAHVIKDADQIQVRFADGKAARVLRIVEEDTSEDFALLKIEGTLFPVMRLGDSDQVRQGERIFALGAPVGLEFSASEGIVSANRGSHLQVTAPISPGNSGGPLFNIRGEAVGIAVFKRTDGENLNFALAINRIKPALNRAGTGTAASGTGERWFVVASKAKDQLQQYKFVSGKDVFAGRDWIQEVFSEGFAITCLAEGKDRWVLMASKGTPYTNQFTLTNEVLPQEAIKEKWDQGYRITTALYGGDRWAVILSKSAATAAMEQSYYYDKSFPSEWIRTKAEKGFRLSAINGDGKQWLVVMTKDDSLGQQEYGLFETAPREWIRKRWDQGYRITSIGNSGNQWAVVMSKRAGYTDQAFWSGESFPAEWIKEQWKQGWDITCIR